jgi:hypothetical protein
MATRAERFRALAQQQGPKKAKRRVKLHTRDAGHTMTRHMTKRGDKKIGAVLEDSASGRPSRLSTRAGQQHGRTDGPLVHAIQNERQTAKSRALRSQVARRK